MKWRLHFGDYFYQRLSLTLSSNISKLLAQVFISCVMETES